MHVPVHALRCNHNVGCYECPLGEEQQFAEAFPSGSAVCACTPGRGHHVGGVMAFVPARHGLAVGHWRFFRDCDTWSGIAVYCQASTLPAEAIFHVRHAGPSAVLAQLLPLGMPMRDRWLRPDGPFMARFDFMEIAFNKAGAPNAAMTPQFYSQPYWRGVGDLRRWCRRAHVTNKKPKGKT